MHRPTSHDGEKQAFESCGQTADAELQHSTRVRCVEAKNARQLGVEPRFKRRERQRHDRVRPRREPSQRPVETSTRRDSIDEMGL